MYTIFLIVLKCCIKGQHWSNVLNVLSQIESDTRQTNKDPLQSVQTSLNFWFDGFNTMTQHLKCVIIPQSIENRLNYMLCIPPTKFQCYFFAKHLCTIKNNVIFSNIIVLGDLNVNFLRFISTQEIHLIKNTNNLTNTIHKPTRITEHTCT